MKEAAKVVTEIAYAADHPVTRLLGASGHVREYRALYEEAGRSGITGRSKMAASQTLWRAWIKAQLKRSVGR